MSDLTEHEINVLRKLAARGTPVRGTKFDVWESEAISRLLAKAIVQIIDAKG